jgi:hypothetical protein
MVGKASMPFDPETVKLLRESLEDAWALPSARPAIAA